MKTVFISSFHPLISRNILATPILSTLAQRPGLRVVIFAPRNKESFFRDQFERGRVRVEVIDPALTRRDRLLRYLSLAQLTTRSLAIKRRTELNGRGRLLNFFIGGRAWSSHGIRWLSKLLTPRTPFGALFDQYQPVLVFATDVQNELDVRMMEAARARGIRVVGMVRSWDNLTSKGFLRFLPETLLVHNEIVRRDAIRLHRVPSKRIVIVGIPHYDAYLRFRPSSRESFFTRIGGNPAMCLIVFAPTGDRYLASNTIDRDIVAMLRAEAPPDCQILVRFPPQDVVRNLEGESSDERVFFERPGTRYTIIPRKVELTVAMDQHLMDTIHHASLVVSGPSTISIDAAVLDRPTILVGFDGNQVRIYEDSVRRYYDYDHWIPILESGGVRLAESGSQFLAAVHAYLKDPTLDREGRARIVQNQCGKLDGQSSARVLNILNSHLDTLP